MSESKPVIPAPRALSTVERIKANMEKTIRGKPAVIDRALVCLLASGHLLVEDLPGLGKTTLAYCLARSIDCSFARIQFTSDLLPSDIIGVSVYDEKLREFSFKRGPIFANIVLADEINRTTPKTQSSLLEVMGRAKLSVDGQTYSVPPPFMVVATQNPVDYEGTFPLPESQLDRFLMRTEMGYPGHEDEIGILREIDLRYDHLQTDPVVSRKEIHELQSFVRDVFVEESVLHYILGIVHATRAEEDFRAGVSPRGALSLKVAAQAKALAGGRSFVLPEDVMELVAPVFAHRLSLRRRTADPLEERRTVEGLLQKIIETVPEPA
jgi:MoxR-like ATPase